MPYRPSREPFSDESWENACHEGERSVELMLLTPAAAEPPR